MKMFNSLLFIAICFFFSYPLNAQQNDSIPQTKIDSVPESSVTKQDSLEKSVFVMVEEMPRFPGGEDNLFKYLKKNIHYPELAREKGIKGRVYITFIINKEGQVKDVKVLRGIGGGCDEEARRVVAEMPDWIPGKQDGKNVIVQFNLPVNFNLR
jgi:periplasmic protein TonB